MNRKTTYSPAAKLSAFAAVIFATCTCLPAQTAPAANADATTKPEEKPIELSPFTVNADSDVGYVATSSLAGSRLNTELRDTAASISVLTSEFLADIGATNLAEALEWANN